MKAIVYLYIIGCFISLIHWIPDLHTQVDYLITEKFLLLYFLEAILVLSSIAGWLFLKGRAKPLSNEKLPVALIFFIVLIQTVILVKDTLRLPTELDIISKIENYPSALVEVIKPGYIKLSGTIGPKTFSSIKQYANENIINGLLINSGGGLIDQANLIGKYLKSNGIDTYVFDHCESACVIIALSGKTLTAKSYAQFGFHQGKSISNFENQYTEFIDLEATKDLKLSLSRLGVPKAILEAVDSTASDSMVYYNGRELHQLGLIDNLQE